MLDNWIELEDRPHNMKLLVNINNISVFHKEAQTILVNGTHCEGNGWYYLTSESCEKLDKKIRGVATKWQYLNLKNQDN